MDEVIRSGKPGRVEDERQGQWFDNSAYPILDETGQTTGLLVYVDDITERKRIERELRETTEKYREIFENTVLGIYHTTPDGRFIVANPASAKILGYGSPDDLIESVVNIATQIYVSPQDRDRALRLIEEQGFMENFEVRSRRKDGSIVWTSLSAHPVRDEAGKVFYFRGTSQDITERKEAERALEEESARRRVLFEQSPDGIVIIDTKTARFLDFNTAAHEQLGYSREEFAKLSIFDLEAKETTEETRKHIADILKSGRDDFETVQHTKQGDIRFIHVTAQIVHIRQDHLYYCVWRDITERKTAEEALRKAEEKYRNLFLNATEGIFQTTPEGSFLSANPALAQILGYSGPEELMAQVTDIGKQIILDPNARPTYLTILDETGVLRDFECEMRKADGTTIWASINARAVRDGRGRLLYYEGTFQDITQRRRTSQQITMQRDLALQFAQLSDLGEALTLILKTGIEVSGMEAGGIWLKQEQTGDLELICSIGVPEGVIRKIGRLKSGTPDWSLWMEGKMVHMSPNKEQTPLAYEDGATYVVIAPILRGGQVIGSLSLASHLREQIAEHARLNLDFLSAELGNIIARMQARQRLEQEVQTRTDAEKALQAERLNLQEMNAALKVLLRQREADRKELEDKVVSNVKELVLPHLEKLKKSRLDASQEMTVDSVEATLKEILSPFLENTRRFNLTPRQTEIVAFIRDGRTTKEIAELLHVSKAAVDKHRYLIRERLGLSNGKTNLRSYLLSLA